MRDEWDTWRCHPVSCLCAECQNKDVAMSADDEDEKTGRYLARRHRPRDCDFGGDHR